MEPMYGKYRAQVVDRNDPLGQGRLRVQATAVLGRRATVWATACLPPGYAALPDVGDTVWIEFEGGDLDHPLWTGCAWSGNSAAFSIDAGGGVTVRATAKVEVTAARVDVTAPMLDVDGVVRGATLIATEGVVSPSYTPGAGNIW